MKPLHSCHLLMLSRLPRPAYLHNTPYRCLSAGRTQLPATGGRPTLRSSGRGSAVSAEGTPHAQGSRVSRTVGTDSGAGGKPLLSAASSARSVRSSSTGRTGAPPSSLSRSVSTACSHGGSDDRALGTGRSGVYALGRRERPGVYSSQPRAEGLGDSYRWRGFASASNPPKQYLRYIHRVKTDVSEAAAVAEEGDVTEVRRRFFCVGYHITSGLVSRDVLSGCRSGFASEHLFARVAVIGSSELQIL